MTDSAAKVEVRTQAWLAAVLVGGTLAVAVWWPLAAGQGLLGGDTYSYFMPQKQLYAQQLASGTLPLWHDRTGFGYPALAESQTAVFYPPNLVLYSVLDVNTAYSWNVILHYCLAFVCCWRLAVACRISVTSSLLVAMIYVYGWFPARVSLEWAIIGGTWFPAAVWLALELQAAPTVRRMVAFAVVLALQLLAGHFTLAFITLVTVGAIVLASLSRRLFRSSASPATSSGNETGWSGPATVCVGIVASLLLAGPQLIPTFELKQRSQRDGATVYHDPGYGHMPPLYLSQLILGWSYWHSPEVVQGASFKSLPGNFGSDTNEVEAHFYVGIIPLLLVLYGLTSAHLRRRLPSGLLRFWIPIGLFSLFYATGWLIPLAKHLPGFGYFIGPGRWTIVATMTLALIAGAVLDAMLQRRGMVLKLILTAAVAALTLPDLLASSKYVADAFPVESPPIDLVDQSWLHRRLSEEPGLPRVFAPGQNLGNLLEVSTYPVYLGLAPAEYYDASLMFPADSDNRETDAASGREFSEAQYQWLQQCGITHVLSEQPLGSTSGRLSLIGEGSDAVYGRAWGSSSEMFLYRLADAEGRVVTDPPAALQQFRLEKKSPGEVRITADIDRDCLLVLREMSYPGWEVTVDGQPATPVTVSGLFRGVTTTPGQHTIEWSYRPRSLWYGIAAAGFGILLLILASLVMNRPAGSRVA